MTNNEPTVTTVRVEGLEDLRGTVDRLDALVSEARILVREMRRTNASAAQAVAQGINGIATVGRRF